jgi:tRNA(Ile)-lysidine synthase
LGVPHTVLHWTGSKPATGLQEAAREARYHLLTERGREIGATHLATAHHADDQAETVLMRLAAGSGLAGLAGMRDASERGGMMLVRPLLSFRKTELIDVCRARSLAWSEDPSNTDQRFGRARLRRIAPLLAAEGLTSERLLTLARRAGEAEEAMSRMATEEIERSRGDLDGGAYSLDWRIAARAPRAVRVRVLAQALAMVPGPTAALEKLEALEADISQATTGLRRTLAGRLITLAKDGELTIAPAPLRRTG